MQLKKLPMLNRIRFPYKLLSEQSALCLLLATHACLLGWIATVNAPVFDEIAHLPAGLTHWRTGDFDLYRVNPPLMRLIATTPLLFANVPEIPLDMLPNGPYARPEFPLRKIFLERCGYDSLRYFIYCRWAQIPVSLLGGWITFYWAKSLNGPRSAFAAAILWCFCPNILAWGATITPDIGAATFGLLAAFTFRQWLIKLSWRNALIAGLTLGVAELAKTTWLILFVLWPTVWFFQSLRLRSQCRLSTQRNSLAQLIIILLLAIYVINVGYAFEKSFRPLGSFQFISATLGGKSAHSHPGNRFRTTALASLPIPLPANFIQGLDTQKYDFEKGKWSYLRGEHKRGGWWYYYAYAFGVKTPTGTLLLVLMSIVSMFRRGNTSGLLVSELVLFGPPILVFCLVSSQTGFNRYYRYVLPALPFIYIIASRAFQPPDAPRRVFRELCASFCLLASIVSGVSIAPHAMSYFNCIAGGPVGGPAHLLDSNIDWGQDLLELERYTQRHPEINNLRIAYFGIVTPGLVGLDCEEAPRWKLGSSAPFVLEPGWYAISVNHVYGYRRFDGDQPDYIYFQNFVPHDMVGYSIYVYFIPRRIYINDAPVQ